MLIWELEVGLPGSFDAPFSGGISLQLQHASLLGSHPGCSQHLQ